MLICVYCTVAIAFSRFIRQAGVRLIVTFLNEFSVQKTFLNWFSVHESVVLKLSHLPKMLQPSRISKTTATGEKHAAYMIPLWFLRFVLDILIPIKRLLLFQ